MIRKGRVFINLTKKIRRLEMKKDIVAICQDSCFSWIDCTKSVLRPRNIQEIPDNNSWKIKGIFALGKEKNEYQQEWKFSESFKFLLWELKYWTILIWNLHVFPYMFPLSNESLLSLLVFLSNSENSFNFSWIVFGIFQENPENNSRKIKGIFTVRKENK